MAVRALFIGLGGTGGVALSFTRAQLNSRLRAAGWTADFPEVAWSFVHVDVPSSADIDSRLSAAETGDALALGASDSSGLTYKYLVNTQERYTALDNLATSRMQVDGLAGWRDKKPEHIRVPISKGAGQFRGIGAMAGVAKRPLIEAHLTEAFSQLSQDTAVAEAQKIRECLGGKVESPREPPYVFIVSSMIGGTGAGLFIEVASIARALFGDFVSAFFVAPEGFDLRKVGSAAPANTWGLVSELQYMLAAGEDNHVTSVAETRLPNLGSSTLDARATATGLFVLGRSNADVKLTGEAAVEKVIGEVLASSVTSDAALENLINYALVNMPVALNDYLGIGRSAAFRSMGFGRLELGRTRFGRYMTDRLKGLVGQRLLSLHVHRRIAEDGSEERLVDAVENAADSLRYIAAERAGIYEIDDGPESHDQILDALRPAPFERWSARHANESAGAGDLEVGVVRDRFVEWAKDRKGRDSQEWREQLADNIRVWTATVEGKLVTTFVEITAEYGLPVAVQTLRFVRDDLQTARKQLNQGAAKLTSLKLGALIGQVIPPGFAGIASEDQRNRLAKTMSGFLKQMFESSALKAAAEACDQVVENLVGPLASALDRMVKELQSPMGRWSRQLDLLPIGGDPSAYRPRAHEVLIEAVDTYDMQFGELIEKSMEVKGRDAAIRGAVSEILTVSGEDWLSVDAGWAPGAIGGIAAVGEPLRVSLDLEPDDVEKLVRTWMQRPDYPIAPYLKGGLLSYVAGGDDARGRFAEALARLVLVAAPLGKTNELVERVHPARTNHWVFTEFPFMNDPDAQKIVQDVVNRTNGASFGSLAWVVDDRDSVELMTEEGPYQALCFETLMAPIRHSWGQATSKLLGNRYAKPSDTKPTELFGTLRHAVPLSMSGPLAQRGLKNLIRGYLIAKASGRYDDWKVLDPGTQQWLPLPKYGYPIDRVNFRDYKTTVGVLLEDMKVAYLDASQDGLKSLRPYQILMQIGHGENYENEISGLSDELVGLSDEQREVLTEIVENTRKIVKEAKTPNIAAKQRSTDVYELGYLLSECSDDIDNALGFDDDDDQEPRI